MQHALSAGPAALAAVGTESSNRKNKLVAASVAVLGASAIAITPVASSPALMEAQHRAVQLVAAIDATGSPLDAYSQLFDNTGASFSNLTDGWTPFPALSQIGENQLGYLGTIADMVNTVPESFNEFWNRHEVKDADGNVISGKKGGADYVNDIQAALQAGDIATAYDALNNLVLRGVDNLLMKPVLSVIFSNAKNVGIPEQIAQNFAAVVGVLANSDTLFKGAFQAVYAPVAGAVFQLSRVAGEVATQIQAGEPTKALNALVNAPAIVADAFLNGFDYEEGDEVAPWAGLLSSAAGCTASSCTPDGPIANFFQTIPKMIAAAIAPPVDEEDTDAVAKTAERKSGLTSLSNLFGQSDKSVNLTITPLAAGTDGINADGDDSTVSDEAEGAEEGDKDQDRRARHFNQRRHGAWNGHRVTVTPAADKETEADTTKGAEDNSAKPAANDTPKKRERGSWGKRFNNRNNNHAASNNSSSNSNNSSSSNGRNDSSNNGPSRNNASNNGSSHNSSSNNGSSNKGKGGDHKKDRKSPSKKRSHSNH